MRTSPVIALVAAVLLMAGCAPEYEIRPAQGGQVGVAASDGISIYADANAWNGQPYDLPNYMTPIAVQIVNRSGHDLRITYADFALVDQNGFRYAAINPYTGTAPERRYGQTDRPVVMLASVGGAPDPGLRYARSEGPRMMGRPVGPQRVPTYTRGRVVVPRGPGVRGPTRVVPGPGRHFYVYPRSHAYFGFYAPWPYAFYWPPYYGLYVYPWSAGYYPERPSADVLRLGLPEGVVKPGGQISGFVYFQNAAAQATSLRLVWTARTPDGKEVGNLEVPFVVVQ